MSTNAREIPWRPSPAAPRVHLKDLGDSGDWSLLMMRYEAGASLPLGPGPLLLYVLEGELIRDGRRLWPGVADSVAPGAAAEGRSEIGCVFLALRRVEVTR